MTLADLKVGDTAVVDHTSCCKVGHRFMEMGFVPGSEIEVLGRCPFGSCIRVKVKGAILALRDDGAALIDVSMKENS